MFFLDFYPDVCVRLPTECDNCIYKGVEYPLGSKIQEGNCEECICEENMNGISMRCHPSCNIREIDCTSVSLLF